MLPEGFGGMIGWGVGATRRNASRLNFLIGLVIVCFGLLLVRLAWISLVRGRPLAAKAVEQRSVDAVIRLARGPIFDRNMELLAGGTSIGLGGNLGEDCAALAVAIFPQSISGPGDSLDKLERMIPGVLDGAPRVIRLPGYDRKEIVGMAKAVTGIVPISIPSRWSGLASHVVGYLTGSQVGAEGIELAFERFLGGGGQGRDVVRAMCDSRGKEIPGLGVRLAVAGEEPGWVRLSIDRRVQEAVERAFDRRAPGLAGAVVVMDPWTGQVMAMASRPSYDQNDVSSSLARADAPLLNRAVYPYYPGSIFKVVVAAAALNEGARMPGSVYHDSGAIQAGGHTFRCHAFERGGHGDITFADAMAYSCNTAFVDAALAVGPGPIVDAARALGIGSYEVAASTCLPNVSTGQTPPRQARMAAAELANFALGQSVVKVTPLEVATMMCAVANDGILRHPTLVLEAVHSASGRVMKMDWEAARALDSGVASKLRSMLSGVVSYGTAQDALGGLNAAGKTGTAQTGRVTETGQPIYNAWFAGFAPADHPKVVISVLVEGAESGADLAAPIFGDICDEVLGFFG
jgi:penicillin-binding protein 2